MSTPPVAELPFIGASIDPDSVLLEELQFAREQSPRATIGEAGTFWDPARQMSEEMMKSNSLALLGREAVYCMRREGESEWKWYCGTLSLVIENGINSGRVSKSTSLLRGVHRHDGPDETFDFPHAGFEYAHVISKDVYWDEWAKRIESQKDNEIRGVYEKMHNLEARMAMMSSQNNNQTQGAQNMPQGAQNMPQGAQNMSQGAQNMSQVIPSNNDAVVQQMMSLLAQNQQLFQLQIRQTNELLKNKGGVKCQLSPENVDCIEFELASEATNVLQWRNILIQGGAERLLDKLENKYWLPHSGKVATRELRELRGAFEVVRDNIKAMSVSTIDWVTSKPLVRSVNKSLEILVMKWQYTTKRISSDDIERLVKSGKTFDKAVKLAELDAEKKLKNEWNGKGDKGRGSWNPQNKFKSSYSCVIS